MGITPQDERRMVVLATMHAAVELSKHAEKPVTETPFYTTWDKLINETYKRLKM